MELISTAIPDVKIFVPEVIEDSRGYFFESFNADAYAKAIGDFVVCQDNESLSAQNVIRGLHFQVGKASQAKLIRVLRGAIWDIAVDLRKNSPTFKKWVGVELSDKNRQQLFVPKGFAHGFVATTETALIQYKVDAYYSPSADRGIRFDDLDLAISWRLTGPAILSPKDAHLPSLKEAEVYEP